MGPKPRKRAVGGQQVRHAAVLDHLATIEEDDTVGVTNRRQAVRHHDPCRVNIAAATVAAQRGDNGRTFWAAGVLQALLTILQLAPYVLLVELARQLLNQAPTQTLIGFGAAALSIMGAGVIGELALMWWLHRVDARFEQDLRRRLLAKFARIPLGWVHRPQLRPR